MKTIFLVSISLLFSLLLFGCDRTSRNRLPFKSTIPLAEVSDEKCFNVQKYISAIYQLSPNPLIRQITTNVVMTSNDSIPHNFAVRLAYASFVFADDYRAAIPELMSVEQKDCAVVTIKTLGGDREDYKVTEIKDGKLRFENESEESYTFEWVTPQHLKTVHSFKFGNYLCDDTLSVAVRVEKDYSWEPEFLAATLLPEDLISPDYLQLVAEASGSSIANPPMVPELKLLAEQPINTEFLNCTQP